jgi:hypothetical protein
MNMIGHQAIGPYFNVIFTAPMGHKINISLVILIGEKGLLPPVAALNYMMGPSLCYYSCYSCHGKILKYFRWKCQ